MCVVNSSFSIHFFNLAQMLWLSYLIVLLHNKFSFKKAVCYTGLQAFRISQ